MWFLIEPMNGRTLPAVKGWLNSSSNDSNRQEGSVKTYADEINDLLRWYATDDVIAMADKEIHNIRQLFLTKRDLCQTLWDLALQCDGTYNK